MTEHTHDDADYAVRGLAAMTTFLAKELREPGFTKSMVGQWARDKKIDVDKFGPREYVSSANRLRASVGRRPPQAA